jgi:hypothetical protein
MAYVLHITLDHCFPWKTRLLLLDVTADNLYRILHNYILLYLIYICSRSYFLLATSPFLLFPEFFVFLSCVKSRTTFPASQSEVESFQRFQKTRLLDARNGRNFSQRFEKEMPMPERNSRFIWRVRFMPDHTKPSSPFSPPCPQILEAVNTNSCCIEAQENIQVEIFHISEILAGGTCSPTRDFRFVPTERFDPDTERLVSLMSTRAISSSDFHLRSQEADSRLRAVGTIYDVMAAGETSRANQSLNNREGVKVKSTVLGNAVASASQFQSS